jgi:amino acid transporter
VASSDSQRTLGLFAATRIGIGAIVGGGILVLAGTAFAHTGPGAIAAFGLNGVLAAVTAMSFAEMASAFPESGGAYAFARRVLSVRAAFAAGWVLWLAYIVAGVLYALGFGVYGVQLLGDALQAAGTGRPGWLLDESAPGVAAALAVVGYGVSLLRRAAGGGELSTWGKVVVLTGVTLAGLWALIGSPPGTLRGGITPFLPEGGTGLLAAMGFTFIALQGFDLIAAVAGEVKSPSRTIPRAMFLSLGTALLIYLPLLLVVSTVGVPPGGDIQALAQDDPDVLMANAARHFMGDAGYLLVTVAAVLSTLSALAANLLAASRVAHTMATDRTLPRVLGTTHPRRGTPTMAIHASALTMIVLLFMVPDLSAAGAAASLIFLLSFALAHVTAYLARRRMGETAEGGYRSPAYPLVPVAGGVGCAALAVFQAVVEPSAAAIALVWLGLGAVLYQSLFGSGAAVADAVAEARDSTLLRLRGRSPRVLVPVGNPDNAGALVEVASALTPPSVGKLLLMSVVPASLTEPEVALDGAQLALRRGMTRGLSFGHLPEATISVAADPWDEIERTAVERECERVLVGLTDLHQQASVTRLETLMNRVRCDLSVLRAPLGFELSHVQRVLVPVGGRGNHEALRARLLSNLERAGARQVRFLQVVPDSMDEGDRRTALRRLRRLAREEVRGEHEAEVIASDDVRATLAAEAARSDLVVMGLQISEDRRKVFGEVILDVAHHTDVAMIVIGSRATAGLTHLLPGHVATGSVPPPRR